MKNKYHNIESAITNKRKNINFYLLDRNKKRNMKKNIKKKK